MSQSSKTATEIERFIRARDAMTDRAKVQAEERMRAALDVKALAVDPEAYVKNLFLREGVMVIRKLKGDAVKIGAEHAERLFGIEDPRA